MTKALDFLIKTPDNYFYEFPSFMDVLSDVLQVIRLSGSVQFCHRLSAPWSIATPPSSQVAALLQAGARQIVSFHIIAEGKCWLEIEGSAEIHQLSKGDIILIPSSRPHILSDQPCKSAVSVMDIMPPQPWSGRPGVKYGGGGAVSHNWTVPELAKRVGVSRSALATRFTQLLAQPPMQYLTQWRLQLAANLLRSTDASMVKIAAQVGYQSEAAFNRAFKRYVDVPPATWRRNRHTAIA